MYATAKRLTYLPELNPPAVVALACLPLLFYWMVLPG